MPSINEVLERVNRARPDAIDDETKAAWLLELDGQLYREVILRHRLHPQGARPIRKAAEPPTAGQTSGSGLHGPAGVCPVCGSTEIFYDRAMDCSSCQACRWSELPEYPRNYPEDGDKPLLVPAPYDGLYDLYLMSKSDFYLRELDNYNNSALAYNTALDEWKKAYHRSHAPIGAGYYKNVF